jgi:hypothetical protein
LCVLFRIRLVSVVAAYNAARHSAKFTVARHGTSRSTDKCSLDAALGLRTRGKDQTDNCGAEYVFFHGPSLVVETVIAGRRFGSRSVAVPAAFIVVVR